MATLKSTKYVLSVTFGDYKNTIGGVAKVVATHQEMFNKAGVSYICIFPFNISNRKHKKNNRYWGVIVDGELEQVCSTEQVINFLFDLGNRGIMCECIHVHHLLYVNIEELSAIIRSLSAYVFFYIHDYYTICMSTKLICDDGCLCERDFLDNEKCHSCRYYSESIVFRSRFVSFVAEFKNRISFIAPSDACKKWFLKQYKEYEDKIIVVYHQTLEGEYKIPERTNNRIKVGYVGVPIAAKGWEQFKKLYYDYQENQKLEFVYFSSLIDTSVDIRHVQVNFQESLSAMQDALRREHVDYVILWSVWPETYSYTYYESYCAGCCVITNPSSGNMADQVCKMKTGLVLREEELFSFFKDINSVAEFRDKYIFNKKSVCNRLIENEKIISLSNGDLSAPIKKFNVSVQASIAGPFLKLGYKLKLSIKK